MKGAQGKFTANYASFMRNQQDLRGEFNKVDCELTKFKNEKLEMFEDFDVDLCVKNIQRLKSMLTDLEDRSSKGQTELESKINAVNKRYNLLLPSTYIDLINKNVLKIDLVKSKNAVLKKLDGEFDYENFIAEVDDIFEELRQDKEN